MTTSGIRWRVRVSIRCGCERAVPGDVDQLFVDAAVGAGSGCLRIRLAFWSFSMWFAELSLTAVFRWRIASMVVGGAVYDPGMMLSVLVYAYCSGGSGHRGRI